MQSVSQSYKTSMASSIRNRSSVEVVVTIDNAAVQKNATASVTDTKKVKWSKPDYVLHNTVDKTQFATLENNLVQIGKNFFFPRSDNSYDSSVTGYVSSSVVGTTIPYFFIILAEETQLPGLEISFGNNPLPANLNIDIATTDGSYTRWKTFTSSEISKEMKITEVFTSKKIRIHTTKMQDSNQRFRIDKIRFTKTDTFTNDDIISMTLSDQISMINEDFPQIDADITIYNKDKRFDIENPESDINFLTQQNQVVINYKYQVDNNTVTTLKLATLLCNEWSSTETEFTLRACDKYRNLEKLYHGEDDTQNIYVETDKIALKQAFIKAFSKASTSFVATLVPQDDMYQIYKTFESDTTVKEVLQLLANIANVTLRINRNGNLYLLPCNGNSTYSGGLRRLSFDDMLSKPDVSKTEQIKDIEIKYLKRHDLTTSTVETETFFSGAMELKKGTQYQFHTASPIVGSIGIYVDGQKLIKWSESSNPQKYREYLNNIHTNKYVYYFKIYSDKDYNFSDFKITVEHFQDPEEVSYTCTLNESGNDITWENNQITSKEIASVVGENLKKYYDDTIEYDIESRGYPEFDTGDVIYQDNDFNENMKVIITSTELSFNGGISQTLHTRRLTE